MRAHLKDMVSLRQSVRSQYLWLILRKVDGIAINLSVLPRFWSKLGKTILQRRKPLVELQIRFIELAQMTAIARSFDDEVDSIFD